MRHLNLKSLALFATLAILLALAGCGGGSDSSTTESTSPPVGRSETTTKSAPPAKQKAAKKGKQDQKTQQPKISRKEIEKEVRKLAESGQPIPANSPVAKKIIQSLTGNGGSGKNGKKGKNSIAQVIEEVVAPSPGGGGGGGSSSGGQGRGPSAGVEKILEQIQK